MENTMKRPVRTFVATALAAGFLAVGGAPALATPGGVGALAAPVLTTTLGTLGGEPDKLNYTCVDGAVKYAIEAAAVYCVGDVTPVPTVVFFEFTSWSCGAVAPEFDFSVDRSTYTVCTGEECPPDPTIDPESVSYKVKGLAVPKGPKGRQNNPFSNWSPELPDLTTVCTLPPV
jgi:hypothetical protein